MLMNFQRQKCQTANGYQILVDVPPTRANQSGDTVEHMDISSMELSESFVNVPSAGMCSNNERYKWNMGVNRELADYHMPGALAGQTANYSHIQSNNQQTCVYSEQRILYGEAHLQSQSTSRRSTSMEQNMRGTWSSEHVNTPPYFPGTQKSATVNYFLPVIEQKSELIRLFRSSICAATEMMDLQISYLEQSRLLETAREMALFLTPPSPAIIRSVNIYFDQLHTHVIISTKSRLNVLNTTAEKKRVLHQNLPHSMYQGSFVTLPTFHNSYYKSPAEYSHASTFTNITKNNTSIQIDTNSEWSTGNEAAQLQPCLQQESTMLNISSDSGIVPDSPSHFFQWIPNNQGVINSAPPAMPYCTEHVMSSNDTGQSPDVPGYPLEFRGCPVWSINPYQFGVVQGCDIRLMQTYRAQHSVSTQAFLTAYPYNNNQQQYLTAEHYVKKENIETVPNANIDFSGKSMLDSESKDIENASKRVLNSLSVRIMDSWYKRNLRHPYPSLETAEVLASAGKITVEQVKKWFANKRLRNHNTRGKKELAKLRRDLREKLKNGTLQLRFPAEEKIL